MATWAQLGLHAKPFGLLDVAGFYDALVAFFDHAVAEGFLRPQHRGDAARRRRPGRRCSTRSPPASRRPSTSGSTRRRPGTIDGVDPVDVGAPPAGLGSARAAIGSIRVAGGPRQRSVGHASDRVAELASRQMQLVLSNEPDPDAWCRRASGIGRVRGTVGGSITSMELEAPSTRSTRAAVARGPSTCTHTWSAPASRCACTRALIAARRPTRRSRRRSRSLPPSAKSSSVKPSRRQLFT